MWVLTEAFTVCYIYRVMSNVAIVHSILICQARAIVYVHIVFYQPVWEKTRSTYKLETDSLNESIS